MAMASERPQPDNSPCDQIMELQSRKEVIEGWLATNDIPAFSSVLQEMLTSVEAKLTVLRDQHSATKSAATNNRLELDELISTLQSKSPSNASRGSRD
jgi:hypothetical protein